MSNSEIPPVAEPLPAPKRRFKWVWIFLGALALAVLAGSVAGYLAGRTLHEQSVEATVHAWDVDQYVLAESDFGSGNYPLALNRLDAILKNEPEYPGAADMRENVLKAMRIAAQAPVKHGQTIRFGEVEVRLHLDMPSKRRALAVGAVSKT